jgi:hypothetical protein
MPEPENNGAETAGRDSLGRFAAGNPGRPKGSRNRTTRAWQAEARLRTAGLVTVTGPRGVAVPVEAAP